MLAGTDDLVVLVALAGNHHHVSGPSPGQSGLNRGPTVGQDHIAVLRSSEGQRPAQRPQTGLDQTAFRLSQDTLRIFAAWIVRG